MLVLNARKTGLGKLSSGDELAGLIRAFIYAGTPSVVASLWNVEDRSTAQLQLIRGSTNSELLARRGIGGVEKLGEISNATLQAPSAEIPVPGSIPVSTSHPYFWAPFILVGDGK